MHNNSSIVVVVKIKPNKRDDNASVLRAIRIGHIMQIDLLHSGDWGSSSNHWRDSAKTEKKNQTNKKLIRKSVIMFVASNEMRWLALKYFR